MSMKASGIYFAAMPPVATMLSTSVFTLFPAAARR